MPVLASWVEQEIYARALNSNSRQVRVVFFVVVFFSPYITSNIIHTFVFLKSFIKVFQTVGKHKMNMTVYRRMDRQTNRGNHSVINNCRTGLLLIFNYKIP